MRMQPNLSARRLLGLVGAAAVLGLLFALVVSEVAVAGAFTPEAGGSPGADTINTVFKVALVILFCVFVAVGAALLYVSVRFRARPGRAPQSARDSGWLQAAFVAGSVAVVIAIGAVGFWMLGDAADPPDAALAATQEIPAFQVNKGWNIQAAPTAAGGGGGAGGFLPASGETLKISAMGTQFIWRYLYPNGAYSYRDLYVPEDTPVELVLVSADVTHSWWVPKLGGKLDAMPGFQQSTWFKAKPAGTIYIGQGSTFDGRQYATESIAVHVLKKEEWQQWAASQLQLISDARDDLNAQRKARDLEEAEEALESQAEVRQPSGERTPEVFGGGR